MKRLMILLLVLAAYRCPAPIESDLVAGIDPTGYSSITAANLLMLVSNGTIGQTNKGAILRGTNTPDTVNNPRYTNFIWMDTSLGLPGILKQWSGSSWVSAVFGNQAVQATNIANGAVGSAQLGTNSVQTYHIANNAVDNTKIGAGQVLNTHLGAGVVSNANIADLTIQGGKVSYNTLGGTNIIDASVNGTKIVDQSITGAKLAPGAIGSALLSANSVYNSNMTANAIQGTNIAASAVGTNKIDITGGSALQVLMIDATGSFAGWGTPVNQRSVVINAGSNVLAGVGFGSTNAHGLGGVPSIVRMVMTNAIAELGYSVGDEVGIGGYMQSGSVAGVVVANASNVEAHLAVNLPLISRKDTNAEDTPTIGRWGLKIYAFR